MKITDIYNDIKNGENIDLYVLILFNIGLVIISLIGQVSDSLIKTLTLAVLSLLATSLLVNRHLLSKVERQANLMDHIEEKWAAPFTKDVETAKELLLTGIHHSSIMNEHYEIFDTMVRNGGRLRVLFVDPEGSACKMAALKFPGSVSSDQEKIRTLASLGVVCELKKSFPDRVEIRILDYLFEYGALLINSNTSKGLVYVQRYTFKVLGGARKPKFVHQKRSEWYELYAYEMEEYWKLAAEWKC